MNPQHLPLIFSDRPAPDLPPAYRPSGEGREGRAVHGSDECRDPVDLSAMAAISHMLEIISSWWVTILTGRGEPTHSSRRKFDAGAVDGVPERNKRRE